VVPIVLASAFGMIFDSPLAPDSPTKLPLAIVCESDDAAVLEFVAALLANDKLEATQTTRDEAERLVADRRPGVAVVFSREFKLPANLLAERPRLDFVHHPLSQQEWRWAEGVLTEAMIARLAGPVPLEAPFRSVSRPVHGAEFNSYSHSFSGMSLQYLLFWGMESGLLLLRERQRGVWRRVRASPVTFRAMLAGKALATAGIAFLQVLVTFAFGYFVFDVRIGGSFAGFLLLAAAISLLAAATGLLVAALGGTEARARSLSILAILAVAMLGGLWLPAFLLPGWARDLSAALPTSWAMSGFDAATWQGRSFLEMLPALGAVSAFAAGFLALASLRLMFLESSRRRGFA
jgi:ABC-2 type transport system permease protein